MIEIIACWLRQIDQETNWFLLVNQLVWTLSSVSIQLVQLIKTGSTIKSR